MKHSIPSSPLEKENSEGFNSSLFFFSFPFPAVHTQTANEGFICSLEQILSSLTYHHCYLSCDSKFQASEQALMRYWGISASEPCFLYLLPEQNFQPFRVHSKFTLAPDKVRAVFPSTSTASVIHFLVCTFICM